MKRLIIFLLIIGLLAAGFFAFGRVRSQQQVAETLASLQTQTVGRDDLIATIGATGIVRSNQTATLLWQTSGSVAAVNVQVGDRVTVDQVLAELGQNSLSQNIILALADLVAAQRDLEDLLNAELQQAQALQAIEDAEQALEDLFDTELQQALGLQSIANAEEAVENAERRVQYLQATAGQADIDAAKAQVLLAEQALERAQEQFDPWADRPENNLTRANLLANLSAKRQEYDDAVRRLNALQSTGNPVAIARAEADLLAAQAELLNAQNEFRDLQDGPSQAQVALAEAQLADAKREYDRIKDGPDPDDIASIEARISAAEATLALAQISAPFNGVVTEGVLKPGDQVAAGSPAFRIDDLSRLLVDVEVSEVDINRVQEGQPVVMTFDAVLAREYHGTVTEVGLVGTEVQGAVSFNVVVEIEDADENVRPGMTSGVNIVVSQLQDVVVVPNRAVRVQEGERVVYIIVDGQLPEAVLVELGSSSDTHSEVIGGELKEGDELVLNPPSDFSFFGGPPGGGPGGG